MVGEINKAAALAHEERIRVDGLEKERQELLVRLSNTDDINDALEIRHRLDKIELKIVEALAVRRHLEAAEVVRGPSQEMIDTLNALLKELAEFQWQTETVTRLIDFARRMTRGLGAEIDKTKALAT